MFLSAAVGFAAVLHLAATAGAQPGGAPPAGGPPAGAPAPTARPTIAVFNMAAVMRDFGQAKYQVHLLNKKRTDMSKELVEWRAEYIKLQQDIPKTVEPATKEKMSKRQVELVRLIEDKDREISKTLNDDASKIISDLYTKIKMVVDKTAEMNGYHIVFAYPDAVTAEELNSPYIHELKLKPPAAQPFYVAEHVDITKVVVRTLNAWYAAPAVPADTPDPKLPSTGPAPGAPAVPGATPMGGAVRPGG
jgi:Skp family chaperone for outer membrane proteins